MKQFYNDADPYTKRAMQMVGAEHLKQFAREVGYDSFVANLKADYEANFITPELEQAQDTLSSFEMVVISKGTSVISLLESNSGIFTGPLSYTARAAQFRQQQHLGALPDSDIGGPLG